MPLNKETRPNLTFIIYKYQSTLFYFCHLHYFVTLLFMSVSLVLSSLLFFYPLMIYFFCFLLLSSFLLLVSPSSSFWFTIFLDEQILYNIPNKSHDLILKTNADLLIKWPTLSSFQIYRFSLGLYFLNIHHWFNITNIIPPSLDYGSLKPETL